MISNWRTNSLGFLINIIFWILLFTFILAIRYYHIGKIAFVQFDINIPLIRIYGNGSVLGVLVGIPYTLTEIYLKRRGLYRSSLALIIIKRTLLHFVITVLVLITGAYINYYVDRANGDLISDQVRFSDYILSATVMFLIIGGLVGNAVLSIFRTLQLKIGEDIFFELLGGKYNPALEEERAFLFIDLKSSTTIAEKLGHTKYSYFIQDCFVDLNPALVSAKASVYQYVGDEAVLTWPIDLALKDSNCVKAYFMFKEQLVSRKDYYLNTYGIFPEFKAGLNLGLVMVAEVGVVKREIAFHSDVLNTAARIQGKCNEKNAWLLVSEDLTKALEPNHDFTIEEKGEVLLRGKSEVVRIFEILEN